MTLEERRELRLLDRKRPFKKFIPLPLHYVVSKVKVREWTLPKLSNPIGRIRRKLNLHRLRSLCTREVLIKCTPVILWWLLFNFSAYTPVEARPDIDVRTLPHIESWYSFPHRFFSSHHHPVLDVLAVIPYTIHCILPTLFTIYLIVYYERRDVLSYIYAFGLMSFAAVLTEYLLPTAPPWYFDYYHHKEATYGMTGHPGSAMLRVDELLGRPLYRSIYKKSPLVFGSFPSLHAAWPFQIALFRPGLPAIAWLYVLWVWWAALYLQHHYLIDILGGALYGYLAYKLVGNEKERMAGRKPNGQYTRFENENETELMERGFRPLAAVSHSQAHSPNLEPHKGPSQDPSPSHTLLAMPPPIPESRGSLLQVSPQLHGFPPPEQPYTSAPGVLELSALPSMEPSGSTAYATGLGSGRSRLDEKGVTLSVDPDDETSGAGIGCGASGAGGSRGKAKARGITLEDSTLAGLSSSSSASSCSSALTSPVYAPVGAGAGGGGGGPVAPAGSGAGRRLDIRSFLAEGRDDAAAHRVHHHHHHHHYSPSMSPPPPAEATPSAGSGVWRPMGTWRPTAGGTSPSMRVNTSFPDLSGSDDASADRSPYASHSVSPAPTPRLKKTLSDSRFLGMEAGEKNL
eukprot:Rmarinus@m.4151